MNPSSKYATGIKYGLIISLVYVVLLFIRYKFFNVSPVYFGFSALVSYVIILVMYYFTGLARRKDLGGYGEMPEIFQAVFIAILITELVYILFNYIYLKYIDPAFWENFKATSLVYYQKQHLSVENMEQAMKGFKDVGSMVKPAGLIRGYGFSIIIDSVFGLAIAAILRKKRPADILPVNK